MSFMKKKDLEQMLKAAEERYALESPVTDWEIAVSKEAILRARETMRLASIGLALDDYMPKLHALLSSLDLGHYSDDSIKTIIELRVVFERLSLP